MKQLLAAAWGVAPGQLYHVSVMPCYDKKLEASRDELTTPGGAGGADGAAAGQGGVPEVRWAG